MRQVLACTSRDRRFKFTDCDLETGREYQISALRLRFERSAAVERLERAGVFVGVEQQKYKLAELERLVTAQDSNIKTQFVLVRQTDAISAPKKRKIGFSWKKMPQRTDGGNRPSFRRFENYQNVQVPADPPAGYAHGLFAVHEPVFDPSKLGQLKGLGRLIAFSCALGHCACDAFIWTPAIPVETHSAPRANVLRRKQ